jgi:cell division protein FtsX
MILLCETWRLVRATSLLVILTVIAAGFLLALGDLSVLTAVNIAGVTSELKQESTLEVFLADGVTIDAIESIKGVIGGFDGVIEVSEIGPDQALDEMSSILGSDLIEILGHNPLPHCLEVRFKPESCNVDYLGGIASDLAVQDEVMEVYFAADWLRSLTRASLISTVVAVLVSAMTSAGILFVYANMQRYASSRRRAVTTGLLLLGVSPWTLRASRLIWTIVVGFLSGLLGLAISTALWMLFTRHVAAVPFFEPGILVLILVASVLLALASTPFFGAPTPGGRAGDTWGAV